MALYLISYDIADKNEFEYQPLWDLLEKLGAVRILDSQWVLPGDASRAGCIYGAVAVLMQKEDRLLVQEITKDVQCDKLLISNEAFNELLAYARG
jgi:hypothetical protein